MADQITFNPLRAADGNGKVVAAAQARFFLSGTTTPATVYTDQTASVAHPTPLVADNRGLFPQVFSSEQLKVEVRNYNGALLPGFPIDPAPTSPPTAGAAAEISFSPTAEIPVTNAQAAIERVQANITTPTLAYGLGVTGSVVLLANIDTTTTASGTYRVDATTTGTFPAGFAPASGGIVEFRRETGSSASMTLHHSNTDRKSTRKMYGGAWLAWREDLTSNETLAAGDVFYHNGTNLVRLPKGSAGQIFRQNDGLTAPAWSDDIQAPATQATTTGTTFEFNSIPAWVKRITVQAASVSLSGSDLPLIQLGTSVGFISSGYIGGITTRDGGGSTGQNTSTAGFIMGWAGATEAITATMILNRIGTSNTWHALIGGTRLNSGSYNGQISGSGSIALAAALTRLRLTRSGSDTFDAGSISITYE